MLAPNGSPGRQIDLSGSGSGDWHVTLVAGRGQRPGRRHQRVVLRRNPDVGRPDRHGDGHRQSLRALRLAAVPDDHGQPRRGGVLGLHRLVRHFTGDGVRAGRRRRRLREPARAGAAGRYRPAVAAAGAGGPMDAFSSGEDGQPDEPGCPSDPLSQSYVQLQQAKYPNRYGECMRDSEVVASIVAGDPEGLAAAYDRYSGPLFGYCQSLLREPDDAADAVQDTFVIAASKLGRLRDPERLRAWLFTVARNECLHRLKSRRAAAVLADIPEQPDESVDVGGEAERAESRALIRAAVGGLNDGERDVINQLWHGLEIPEVAMALGVSRNHAHSLFSRARDQLEASVGVLVVGRSGRKDCAALDQLLHDWDGRLTAPLRRRVGRHIDRCSVCSDRRRRELRPAALLVGRARCAGRLRPRRRRRSRPPGPGASRPARGGAAPGHRSRGARRRLPGGRGAGHALVPAQWFPAASARRPPRAGADRAPAAERGRRDRGGGDRDRGGAGGRAACPPPGGGGQPAGDRDRRPARRRPRPPPARRPAPRWPAGCRPLAPAPPAR